MTDIADNLSLVKEKISSAAQRAGRDPRSVKLVAVSKTVAAEVMCDAADAGQLIFGENYVQSARDKIPAVKESSPAEFHLIGALQRNKVKLALELFDLIQTVDRISLAEEISKQASKLGKQQEVLLQVNISNEESKSGCAVEDTLELAKYLMSADSIKLIGLMCIGTWYTPDVEETTRRAEFTRMRSLRDDLQESLGLELPELSMGMSADYELAIEEGATIVRVGSAIFGARN